MDPRERRYYQPKDSGSQGAEGYEQVGRESFFQVINQYYGNLWPHPYETLGHISSLLYSAHSRPGDCGIVLVADINAGQDNLLRTMIGNTIWHIHTDIHGIAISPQDTRTQTQKDDDKQLNIKYHIGPVEETLDWYAHGFDLIVGTNLKTPSPLDTIARCYTALTPGGELYVTLDRDAAPQDCPDLPSLLKFWGENGVELHSNPQGAFVLKRTTAALPMNIESSTESAHNPSGGLPVAEVIYSLHQSAA